MKQKKHNRNIIKWTLSIFLIIFSLIGCRKTENIWTNQQILTEDYNLIRANFFNSSNSDIEVKKVAADIRKQDSLFKFLPDFIKKNGIPIWGKTLYKTKGSSPVSSGSLKKDTTVITNNSSNSSNEADQGIFFIPLQAQNSQEIKSYITAYKHGDSAYSYKLYNKDSLSTNSYQNGDTKKALINSLGVLAFFEKSINNKETSQYNLSDNEIVEFKNPNITLSDTQPTNQLAANSNTSSTTSTPGCSFSITITETWTEINVYVNGELVYHYESYEVSVVASIQGDCSGGGGGSGGGYDPGGGSGNWYNWGTGYNGDPYWYNNNYNWWLYPWWTLGGGGSGGGGGNDPYQYQKSIFDTYLGDEDDNVIGEIDTTSYQPYQIGQPWDTIANVIPEVDFVGWGTPNISENCMSYAKAQILKKGYKISNYYTNGQTIQAYTSANGADSNAVKDGIGYLISALNRGIPVIVGVDDQIGSPNPQTDNTTDHFVVIVGMGSDANGNYFTFYDNASGYAIQGTSPNNKLYFNPTTWQITGTSQTAYASGLQDYILTMIRKSK